MPAPKIYLYQRVVQARLFIDRNFHEKLDLDQIADEACFSKFHFIRLFKSIYNLTPHHYLTKVRIENAKLLLQQKRSVTETCFEVGFESQSSFSALFTKYVRCSPSVYQAQYLKRQEKIRLEPLHFIPNCFSEGNGWK